MNPREINIQIEELILHGFPANVRHQIGTVVETELVGYCRSMGCLMPGGQMPIELTSVSFARLA